MALILTRRAGETIKIGEDISITVVAVQGGQAKIAIDAPKDVAVHRQEIYDRIQREVEEIPQFEGTREALKGLSA